MNFITAKEYFQAIKNDDFMEIGEEREEYELLEAKENLYENKKVKENDKKHDKMFRDILGRKKEIIKFLNKFLDLEEIVKEENIEQGSADFITKQYKDRHSDLVYKLKDEPIYF